MALFYMNILFYINLLLGMLCILPIVLRNGEMIKNKLVCVVITLITLLIGMINYTSLPDNYILQKVEVALVVIMVEIGLLINNVLVKYTKVSKILIAAGLLGNVCLLVA